MPLTAGQPAPAAAPRTPRALRVHAEVASCIASAVAATEGGRWAEGVEWIAASAVLDIQRHHGAFLVGAAEAGMLCDQYARCFAGAGIGRAGPAAVVRPPVDGRPLRLGYIISSIVQGQAASGRLARMVELHDRSRFEPCVIVAEEFTQRTPARPWLKWPDAPSRGVGAGLIERIEATGAPVSVVPARGDYLDGAHAAIEVARSMTLDIAVFIASPACPIQAAMAWARVAPVQINQNIAVPMPIAGIDAVLYHNAWCAADDRPELSRRGIQTLTVTGNGTDVDAADRATAVERSRIGVPRDAVLLATAGNRLPGRLLHGGFVGDLAAFLKSESGAWWMAVGPGDFTPVQRAIELAGGTDALQRCIFVGPQRDIRPYLKVADIYLNEYPEGGANTVLEAMACGVPAAAMRAGPRHTESIGAELTGDGVGDAAAYWRRATEWCADAAVRRANALAQGKRVREQLGYEAICRQYERWCSVAW